jgi:hypothetical protein
MPALLSLLGIGTVATHLVINHWEAPVAKDMSETGARLPPKSRAARRRLNGGWICRAATEDEAEHAYTMRVMR